MFAPVRRDIVNGRPVPRLTPTCKQTAAKRTADEFTVAIADLEAVYRPIANRKNAGEQLGSAEWSRMLTLRAALHNAKKSRDHKNRMQIIEKALGRQPAKPAPAAFMQTVDEPTSEQLTRPGIQPTLF